MVLIEGAQSVPNLEKTIENNSPFGINWRKSGIDVKGIFLKFLNRLIAWSFMSGYN